MSAVTHPTPAVYHERQRLQHCLQHTLNCLFQRKQFTCADLDALCSQLAPGAKPFFNPHRTFLFGNYDVSCLELALNRHGKELRWHDRRDVEFRQLDLEACWGVIVNVRGTGPLAWLLRGRHWFALKRLDGCWYNMDSHLQAPEPLGDAEAVRRFLIAQAQERDALVFLVTEQRAGGAAQPQLHQKEEAEAQEQVQQERGTGDEAPTDGEHEH